jgi:hypothetical protein
MSDLRSRQLARLDYALLEPLAAAQARFLFQGPFHGRETLWDATFLTLARYHTLQPPCTDAVIRRPFFEIGAVDTDPRAITIALDIPHIDEPAILRAIVMIRQYRRLRVGRHEFGLAREFPSATSATDRSKSEF